MYKQITPFAIAATLALLARKKIIMAKKLTLFGIVLLLAGVPFAQERSVHAFFQTGLPEGAIARWGTGPPRNLAYSPDGLTLAVSTLFAVWLLDVRTDSPVAMIPTDRMARWLSYSPDGATLLIGDESGNVRMWDVASGEEKATLRQEAAVYSAVFSSDGATLLIGDESGNVRMWDVASGEEKAIPNRDNFREHGCEGSVAAAFVLDGEALSVACDGRLMLWYLKIGTAKTLLSSQDELFRGRGGYDRRWVLWQFSADGTTLVTVNYVAPYGIQYAITTFIDASSGELIGQISTEYGFNSNLALSPVGRTIVNFITRAASVATVYDASKDEPLEISMPVLLGDSRTPEIFSVAVSPDGTTLAVISEENNQVYFMDIVNLDQRNRTVGEWNASSQIFALSRTRWLSFSPDGATLAVEYDYGYQLRLLDVASGKVKTVLRVDTDAYTSRSQYLFSPDGATLAAVYRRGSTSTLNWWDLASSETKAALVAPESDYISTFAFSPDGAMIATAGRGIHLRDATGKQKLVNREAHDGDRVTSLAFSPDGSVLASASSGGQIRIWELSYLSSMATFQHGASVMSLAFSPDESALVSFGEDGTVRTWDMASRKLVVVLEVEDHRVIKRGALALSPDGLMLVSMDNDGTVRTWDVASGKLVVVLEDHRAVGNGVWALSPDGFTLATSPARPDIIANDTVLLWDLTPYIVPKTPTPDFDGNDQVDFADFLAFIARFGTSRGDSNYDAKYDLDSDGTIGFSDFLIFTSLFGTSG